MGSAAQQHADSHGSTPAAWTLVAIVLAGFLVGAVGLWIGSATTFWLGVALVPVGVLVGYVMKLLGFGVPAHTHHVPPTGPDAA